MQTARQATSVSVFQLACSWQFDPRTLHSSD